MSRIRPASLAIFVLCVLWLGAGLLLAWLTYPAPPHRATVQLALRAMPAGNIPGWRADPKAGALAAFQKSCKILRRWPDARLLSRGGLGGRAADWKAVCNKAIALGVAGDAAAQAFFETEFQAFALDLGGQPKGLFTGYYEPTLRGSRSRTADFSTPLYRRPTDLMSADLGLFDPAWKGRRLVGRLVGRPGRRRLLPYPDRAAIDAGALAGRNLEIVYVDDPVDAFFLHIQGSGRIKLRDGREIGVGYAGQNGHKYVAIGRELIARGHLSRAEVSMPAIRAWLAANPEKRQALLNSNPSYIFFREGQPTGAVGALGAVLTPGRSLAVDRSRLPLAAPLFVITRAPVPGGKPRALRRLMVAQDVGGAIKGAIRGDIFFGPGPAAAFKAGHMNAQGRLYLLLPKALKR